jgi:uncharacterized protein DUF4279
MVEFDLSLRVTHPAMDPALITRTLQLQPHTAWQVGSPRRGKDGRQLKGIYEDSYWAHRLSYELRETPEKAVDGVLNMLQQFKDFFARIFDTGGRTELFLGIYITNSGGLFFGCELLRLAADAKIDLSLDIYSR